MSVPHRFVSRQGFTLIELLVVISIIALLIGILLPALGSARTTARQLKSSTQSRGIHQAFVTHAQSNKGWFPGIRSDGKLSPIADSILSGAEGHVPQGRMGRLLEGNYLTPEYLVSPVDSAKDVYVPDYTGGVLIKSTNFSYAVLRIDTTGASPASVLDKTPRSIEWSETLNTQAIAVSDRNSGSNVTDEVSSPWTKQYGGEWRGTVTRNDNSTSFETSHFLATSRHGNAASVADDNIFDPDDGAVAGDNTAMVFSDETTSSGHDE